MGESFQIIFCDPQETNKELCGRQTGKTSQLACLAVLDLMCILYDRYTGIVALAITLRQCAFLLVMLRFAVFRLFPCVWLIDLASIKVGSDPCFIITNNPR
jgi:hypothetical protein